MDAKTIDAALTAALWGVGLYFTALNLRALQRYQRYRLLRGQPLVAWSAPSPRRPLLSLAVGLASAALALAGLVVQAPLQVFSQGMTALYFLGATTLLASTRPGLYMSGVWSPPDFLPYSGISRWALPESEPPYLIVLPRSSGRPIHLDIPRDELGTVIKYMDQKTREHVLNPGPRLLDLSQP
jgi:hypothetical protein